MSCGLTTSKYFLQNDGYQRAENYQPGNYREQTPSQFMASADTIKVFDAPMGSKFPPVVVGHRLSTRASERGMLA